MVKIWRPLSRIPCNFYKIQILELTQQTPLGNSIASLVSGICINFLSKTLLAFLNFKKTSTKPSNSFLFGRKGDLVISSSKLWQKTVIMASLPLSWWWLSSLGLGFRPLLLICFLIKLLGSLRDVGRWMQ
jgi:hypothetical protein